MNKSPILQPIRSPLTPSSAPPLPASPARLHSPVLGHVASPCSWHLSYTVTRRTTGAAAKPKASAQPYSTVAGAPGGVAAAVPSGRPSTSMSAMLPSTLSVHVAPRSCRQGSAVYDYYRLSTMTPLVGIKGCHGRTATHAVAFARRVAKYGSGLMATPPTAAGEALLHTGRQYHVTPSPT